MVLTSGRLRYYRHLIFFMAIFINYAMQDNHNVIMDDNIIPLIRHGRSYIISRVRIKSIISSLQYDPKLLCINK